LNLLAEGTPQEFPIAGCSGDGQPPPHFFPTTPLNYSSDDTAINQNPDEIKEMKRKAT
jgi:hypothetical protein